MDGQGNRRRWRRPAAVAGIILAITSVLLFAGYLYLTSESFLRHTLLPWLGKISNSEYSARHIELSLWHGRLRMTGVRVGSREHPFVTGDLSGTFSLWRILHGDIRVDKLTLDNVQVTLRQRPDGEWLIPFGSKSPPAEQSKQEEEVTDTGEVPVFLNITNAAIKRINFHLITATGEEIVVSDGVFTLPKLKNGQLCPFKLTGKLRITSAEDIRIISDRAVLDGAIELRPDFMVKRVNMRLSLRQFSGKVNRIALRGNEFTAAFKSVWDDNGFDIEKLEVTERRQGRLTTSLKAAGRLDFSPFALHGSIDFEPVSDSLVALIFSCFDLVDPGNIALKYHGKLSYRRNYLKSKGLLLCRRRAMSQAGGKPLPPGFVLKSLHDVEIDLSKEQLKISKLALALLQNQRQIIGINISPAFLAMNNITAKPLATTLTVDGLDVSLLRTILPDYASVLPLRGKFFTRLRLHGSNLQNLRLSGRAVLRDGQFEIHGKHYDRVNLSSDIKLKLANFRMLDVEKWQLGVTRHGQKLAELTINGSDFDLTQAVGRMNVKVSGMNYETLQLFPVPAAAHFFLTRIAPFNAALQFASHIELPARRLTLNHVKLTLNSGKGGNIVFSLDEAAEFNWFSRTASKYSLHNMRIKISNLLPQIFNSMLPDGSLLFNSGWINADMRCSLSDNAERVSLQGRIDGYELGFVWGGIPFDNLQLSQTVDIRLFKHRDLEIKTLLGSLAVERRPLLQYECGGKMDFSSRHGEIRLYFNIPTPELVDRFMPQQVEELKLDGVINAATTDMFANMRLGGKIKLQRLKLPGMLSAVRGESDFDIKKHPGGIHLQKILLRAATLKQRQVLDLTAHASTGRERGHRVETIDISSRMIDLKLLEALFRPAEPAEPAVTEPPPYSFDFGPQWYRLNVALGGISYGAAVKCRVDSSILLAGRRIKIDPLKISINQRELNMRADLFSRPAGVCYRLQGEGRDMVLGPIFQAVVNGKMKNSRARLDWLKFNISGNGIAGNRLWDGMRGELKVDASQISLPNTVRDTVIGNIMFLPLDGIAEFQKLMPGNLWKLYQHSAGYRELFKRVEDFKFDRGVIRARAADRLIYVDRADFFGPLIKRLQFNGFIGLGSRKIIALKSSLVLLGVTMNLGISGTPDEPRLELLKFIPQAIGSNVLKILDIRNIPAIFKGTDGKWLQIKRGPAAGKSNNKRSDDADYQSGGDNLKKINRFLQGINRILEQ